MNSERAERELWISSTWMIFESNLSFLRTMTHNSSEFARIHDPWMKIGHRLENLASIAVTEENAGYYRCCSVAFELFSELAAATLIPGTSGEYALASKDTVDTVAERTMRYLKSHFREALSVASIANALGMSASTISHQFRKETGETIIKCLQRIQLEQSIPYLLRGTPLKEVAPATGFQNEFYYSKVFRHHYGMPPNEWRTVKNPIQQLGLRTQ